MKKSFGDCENCPLLKQEMVIGETNCSKDLSSVDILVFAEAPAVQEVQQGRPLVGDAGKIYRSAAEKTGISNLKQYLGNVIFCANIQNGRTQNPPPEALRACAKNVDELIKLTKPKLILAMGTIPMVRFNIATEGITKRRGLYENQYKGHNVFLTAHPSYVMRNGGLSTSVGRSFLNDLQKVYQIVSGKSKEETKITGEKLTKCYGFKYPDWMLSDNIVLIDVQDLKEDGEILFLFRDINTGEKKYYSISNKEYYFYVKNEPKESTPMLLSVSEVSTVKEEAPLVTPHSLYESDVRTAVKHSIDYYFSRKQNPEKTYPLKKMFWDIEIYNGKDKTFPNPKEAKKPINAISYKVDDGKVHVLINTLPEMHRKQDIKVPEDVEAIFFPNETTMIKSFCNKIKKHNPDILSAWNGNMFDIPTIFGRMKKKNLNLSQLSPIDKIYFNPKRYNDFYIGGLYVLDQLELYKQLTESVEESYKLSAISQKVLGKGKVAYEGTLDEVYETDIETFINYSATDTRLLWELENKLQHIDQKNELRKICSSTWKNSEIVTGLIDPLMISFAKEENLVCKNAVLEKTDETIPGAYVRNPKGGLFSWIIDLDFTSLYPSIICSVNVGPNTYVGRIDPKVAEVFIYKHEPKPKELKIIYDPMLSKQEKTISYTEFEKWVNKNNYIVSIAGTIFKSQQEEMTFFYKVQRYIINSRNEYKDRMKEAKKNNDKISEVYDNRQKALKIINNAMYGVLANHGFRMFNLDLASTITLTGQELVKFLIYHVGHYMKEDKTEINPHFLDSFSMGGIKDNDEDIPYIMYSDTDSAFVQIGDWLIDKGILEI